MNIKVYSGDDEEKLFDMIREEGRDWECYWGEDSIEKYKKALNSSTAYVVYDKDILCGYLRCRDDDGFGVYIYDLLVKESHRGKYLGRMLMDKVREDFPEDTVYVMSDVDGYYKKLGYKREGSIFIVE